MSATTVLPREFEPDLTGRDVPSPPRAARTAALLASLPHATEGEREQVVQQVVTLNMGVADAIASRYAGRGIEVEDLRQVAYLALVRAARKYDATYDVSMTGDNFLSYCVPTIRGEIRRHFRDHGWMVRPPRRIQELQRHIPAARAELSAQLGRAPRPREIAAHLDEDLSDVLEALSADGCFRPASLDQPVGDENAVSLGELIEGDLTHGLLSAEARAMLAPLIRRLPDRDRQILLWRFTGGWTQQEIATEIGVTQMQVSRLLARILADLRTALSESRGASPRVPSGRPQTAASWAPDRGRVCPRQASR